MALSLRQLPVQGRRVLMRVDFNVPLDESGRIADDTRLRAALPSIEYVLKEGGSLILMSHLGRPKAAPDPKYSLSPCAERLAELLKKPVLMASAAVGPQVEEMARALQPGQVLMLENVRFYPGEEKPASDPSFAKNLAQLGDCYVDDAFGAAHRKHASIVEVPRFFPQASAMGLLMEREIAALSRLYEAPKRPFYAFIGGAKVSSKAGVLKQLLERIDALFIGGGMAFTFLKSQGVDIGRSLFSKEDLPIAREILTEAQSKNIPLRLPIDFVVADAFSSDAQVKVVDTQTGIPKEWFGMDIGPKTVEEWGTLCAGVATIFWNGPMGVVEMPQFAEGTQGIAAMLAKAKAYVVVGGGDSVAAVQKMGFADAFGFLSTGGGASLEFLEFGHLPGIDILSLANA